jgi:hypothetical protein
VVFDRSIKATLCSLVDDGFSAAWMGVEGLFADPPWLFTPEMMTGGVLAACTRQTGYLTALQLDAPFRALEDADLTSIREATLHLAGTD